MPGLREWTASISSSPSSPASRGRSGRGRPAPSRESAAPPPRSRQHGVEPSLFRIAPRISRWFRSSSTTRIVPSCRPTPAAPRGSTTSTRVPFPGSEESRISPSCASTIFFVSTSPRPRPDSLVVKYGSNIRSRSFPSIRRRCPGSRWRSGRRPGNPPRPSTCRRTAWRLPRWPPGSPPPAGPCPGRPSPRRRPRTPAPAGSAGTGAGPPPSGGRSRGCRGCARAPFAARMACRT